MNPAKAAKDKAFCEKFHSTCAGQSVAQPNDSADGHYAETGRLPGGLRFEIQEEVGRTAAMAVRSGDWLAASFGCAA